MSPLLILFVAVLLVVAGVLVLRLHAALALLAAAVITSLLTPVDFVYQHEITSRASRVVRLAAGGQLVTLQSGSGKSVLAGTQWVFRRDNGQGLYRQVGKARLVIQQFLRRSGPWRRNLPCGQSWPQGAESEQVSRGRRS